MSTTRETEARGLPGKPTAQPRQDETPARASALNKATTTTQTARLDLWRRGWVRLLAQPTPTEQRDAQ